ncbi:hypothetical protein DOY81_000984, partial [Sarcophaga bullata]
KVFFYLFKNGDGCLLKVYVQLFIYYSLLLVILEQKEKELKETLGFIFLKSNEYECYRSEDFFVFLFFTTTNQKI